MQRAQLAGQRSPRVPKSTVFGQQIHIVAYAEAYRMRMPAIALTIAAQPTARPHPARVAFNHDGNATACVSGAPITTVDEATLLALDEDSILVPAEPFPTVDASDARLDDDEPDFDPA